MVEKGFIKIINEEISKFDFLSNESYLQEQEGVDMLLNEEFQKQFICDSLVAGNKIKTSVRDSRIGGNWEDDDFDGVSKLTIEYFLSVEYTYDQNKDPLKFGLDFYSDAIDISKTGWYDKGRVGGTTDSDVAPSGEAWFDRFDWNDIGVSLSTEAGDEIKFVAFTKAPPRIQTLFIRQYTESYIMNYTSMEIRTPEMRDNAKNVSYC